MLKKSVYEVYGQDPDPIFQGWFRIRIQYFKADSGSESNISGLIQDPNPHKKEMDPKPLINNFLSCSDLGSFLSNFRILKNCLEPHPNFLMRRIFLLITIQKIVLFCFIPYFCFYLESPVVGSWSTQLWKPNLSLYIRTLCSGVHVSTY